MYCIVTSTKVTLSRLQRLQNVSASYVLNRYARESGVVNLGWLPMIERLEYSTCKLAAKALYANNWPEYLPLYFNESKLPSRRCNDNENKLAYIKENRTFAAEAYKHFNNLPPNLRKENNSCSFSSLGKKYFLDKASARTSYYVWFVFGKRFALHTL